MTLHPREAEANALQHRIPLFAARVLHVDCGPGLLCLFARRRSGAETVGVFLGDDAAARSEAEGRAGRIYDSLHDALVAEAPFDCIVIPATSSSDDFARSAEALAPEGQLLLDCDGSEPIPVPSGFVVYARWPFDFPMSEMEEVYTPAPGERHLVVHARAGYDPLAHAQRLAAARQFDRAYEILCAIPPEVRENPAFDARVQVVKMVCLLGLHKLGAYPALTCLAGALFLFARVQRRLPNEPATLRLLARFWDAVGMGEMGLRLSALADELEGRVVTTSAVEDSENYVEPPSSVISILPSSPPRVLFITGNDRVNYGLDVLYHGLQLVLGEGNCVDFPYKATLHGAPAEAFGHYPALFAHTGTPRAASEILALLPQGHFDGVVWGDADMELPRELAQAIAAAAHPVRLALVDMRDDCADHSAELCAWLGLTAPPPYFKRELLRGVAHACPVTPLTFAYPDALVAAEITAPRLAGAFWAGQRGWGLRDVFLPVLEARGIETRISYTQEAYRARLQQAQACVNLAGAGFDTVRYWEAPAQGALLLSEMLPLAIPHDFVDMRDAMFFATRGDLDARLTYLEAHPAEVEAMRHAGWEKLRRFHTASARARQFLTALA